MGNFKIFRAFKPTIECKYKGKPRDAKAKKTNQRFDKAEEKKEISGSEDDQQRARVVINHYQTDTEGSFDLIYLGNHKLNRYRFNIP